MVDSINIEIWEELKDEWKYLDSDKSIYCSYEWLKSVEGMLGNKSCYIIAKNENGELVGGVSCYIIDNLNIYAFYNIPKFFTDKSIFDETKRYCIDKAVLTELYSTLSRNLEEYYPILISCSPYGYKSSFIFSKNIDNITKKKVAEVIIKEFNDLSTKLKVKLSAFLYIEKEEREELYSILNKYNYKCFFTEGNIHLPIRWSSFDNYLNSLNGNRRKKIRKEIETFNKMSFTIKKKGCKIFGKETAKLQSNLQKKYGHGGDISRLKKGYRRITKYLSKYVTNFIIEKDNNIYGVGIFYLKDNKYYAKAAGFDYNLIEGSYAYFNLVFYEPIRDSILNGIKEIDYGIGSVEAKLLRGCIIKPLFWAIKFNHCKELYDFIIIWEQGRLKLFNYYYEKYCKVDKDNQF